MKTYGLYPGMRGCCPGHDDFPDEYYGSRRSVKAHRVVTKLHRRAERRTTIVVCRAVDCDEA